MTDTIDLLEAIGSDASLRHASAGEMAQRLEQAQASAVLVAAAAAGDGSVLSAEFGQPSYQTPQITQMPAHEEDEEEEEVPLESPVSDTRS